MIEKGEVQLTSTSLHMLSFKTLISHKFFIFKEVALLEIRYFFSSLPELVIFILYEFLCKMLLAFCKQTQGKTFPKNCSDLGMLELLMAW